MKQCVWNQLGGVDCVCVCVESAGIVCVYSQLRGGDSSTISYVCMCKYKRSTEELKNRQSEVGDL